MKSSIRIDFIDRGMGAGIEPVIKVDIKHSDDPRDTLVSHLFQSIRQQSFLQIYYTNHKHITTADALPDMEKTVLLFKPEYDTDELLSIVRNYFYNWLREEKYIPIEGEGRYKKGKDHFWENELYKNFISLKAAHTS